jgi:hypothetical protein
LTIVPANDSAGAERTISLPVTKSRFASWDVVSDSVVGFLLPATSLLLGFWVAFRPSPRSAGMALARVDVELSACPANLCRVRLAAGWREAGALYESTLEAAFPIIIFLS